MNYQNLKEEEKNKLNKLIKEKYPNAEIDVDDIKIINENNTLKISYKDIRIELPIGKPDQQTTNGIWQTVVGGVIAIAAATVVLIVTKDNKA